MNFKKIQQSSVALMLVITISKLIGILRDIVLANYYGTSYISDAYLIASSVPTVLFYFIGNSLSTAYIPMFSKVKEQSGEKKAQRYSNNILTMSFIIATIMVLFLLLFPNIAVRIFASGFDTEAAKLAGRLIRISAVSIYFMIAVSVFTGYLQSNKSFLIPAAVSLPRNAAIIASVVFSVYFGTDCLGWGLLAAFVLEFLFLLPFTLRKGYRYSPVLDLKEENLSQTMTMVLPILLGTFVARINGIVDRSIASNITEGGISALTYAGIIDTGINEILVTSIITMMFVDCSSLVAKGKHDDVKMRASSTIGTLIFLLVPASAGVVALVRPIVTLLLYRGSFGDKSLELTSATLVCYILGIVFVAVNSVIVKIFYAYKDTRTTTIVSFVSIGLNIVLNLVLSYFMGVPGLALSTTISSLVGCVSLFLLLRKKIGDYGTKGLLTIMLKSIISSLIMFVAVSYIYKMTDKVVGLLPSLLISVISGVVTYLFVSLILRNKVITDLWSRVLIKIKK